MKAKNIIRLVLFALGFTFIFSACKKQANLDYDSSEDEVMASVIGNDIDQDADAVSFNMSSSGFTGKNDGDSKRCHFRHFLPDCADVTISSDSFPKEIVIDYGSGCTDKKGRVKRGKIIIYISDFLLNEGAYRRVSFQEYYFNDKSVEGSKLLENIGTDDEGHPMFSKEVSLTVTSEKGTITKSFSGTITWLAGYDTDICGDNVFSVAGSGSIVVSDGRTFTRRIVEDIIIDRLCGYIVDGLVELVQPNGDFMIIDFGDGTCDDLAEVTRDGETKEIDLDEVKIRRKPKRK